MKRNLLLVFIIVMAVAAEARATDAGSVLFATGPVTAEREPPVALARGDIVVVGDTIATGVAARAQLLMLDGAKVAIRPYSRFRIEEFNYSGPDVDDGQVVISSNDERSVSSLLKGGFRTITGAIGKEHEANYEVRTPVGVLGVRGTDYTAVYCSGDCNWVPGVSPTEPIEDGLYLGVSAGTIVFRNENGDIELSAGEFAFIPVSDRRLRELLSPPPMFLDENDLLRSDGAAPGKPNDGSQKGFDDALGARRLSKAGDNLVGSSLLDGNLRAIRQRQIECRRRRRNVERHSEALGRQSHRQRTDLVRRVAVTRNAIGADDDAVDAIA